MALAATEFAPAKVNLALHVTGQRADGYHLLDSLVAFADLGDTLDIAAGEGLTLTVEGPRAAGVGGCRPSWTSSWSASKAS